YRCQEPDCRIEAPVRHLNAAGPRAVALPVPFVHQALPDIVTGFLGRYHLMPVPSAVFHYDLRSTVAIRIGHFQASVEKHPAAVPCLVRDRSVPVDHGYIYFMPVTEHPRYHRFLEPVTVGVRRSGAVYDPGLLISLGRFPEQEPVMSDTT